MRPILAEHCSSCHSGSVGKLKGELSLDSRAAILAGGESGPAVVPGKPDESLLIEAVRRESFEMPPEKPLSNRELRTLERWVESGAPWPENQAQEVASGNDWLTQRFDSHWAWQPVTAPAIPDLPNDDWSAGPIDRFILAKLQENDLQPAAPCEPHALRRRLNFDLVGLPPSEQPQLLLSKEDYVAVVEQLLGSPQFGVRWGRHWLDLVRYAETLGHEFDYPLRYAWHYRDAVIDAFNIDVPYDRLLSEHLAGDLITPARRQPATGVNQSLAMTGFWWLGDSVHAPVDLRNDLATRVDNQIDVFSKTFMGMTVACARCHDHKFDAISTHDYYGLAGVIESSRREYAITDPTGSLAQHWSQTADEIDQANQAACTAFSRLQVSDYAIDTWLSALLANLRSLDSQELDEVLPSTSPLALLRAALSDRSMAESLSTMRAQVIKAEDDFEAWESESVLWSDFSKGVPATWQLSATQHTAGLSPALEELWNASVGRSRAYL